MIKLSLEEREDWIAAAWEYFDDALRRGDISHAKDIIADAQDADFLEEGRKMNEQLREYAANNQ